MEDHNQQQSRPFFGGVPQNPPLQDFSQQQHLVAPPDAQAMQSAMAGHYPHPLLNQQFHQQGHSSRTPFLLPHPVRGLPQYRLGEGLPQPAQYHPREGLPQPSQYRPGEGLPQPTQYHPREGLPQYHPGQRLPPHDQYTQRTQYRPREGLPHYYPQLYRFREGLPLHAQYTQSAQYCPGERFYQPTQEQALYISRGEIPQPWPPYHHPGTTSGRYSTHEWPRLPLHNTMWPPERFQARPYLQEDQLSTQLPIPNTVLHGEPGLASQDRSSDPPSPQTDQSDSPAEDTPGPCCNKLKEVQQARCTKGSFHFDADVRWLEYTSHMAKITGSSRSHEPTTIADTLTTPPPKRRKCYSPEYQTVLNCTQDLETALTSTERNLVHFLLQEGFITEEVHTDVLNPRSMLNAHSKAGKLVSEISNQVQLNSHKYSTFVMYLRNKNYYESLLSILDEEYSKQQQAHATQHLDDHMTQDMSPLAQYKAYLKSVYANLSTKDEKLFTPEVCQFVSLALIKKEKSSNKDKFSRSTFHGGVDEILESKTLLELDALVTGESKFVLVEGPPGIGKSTLCSELCKKWDTLESLRHYKIVLLLKLQETCVQRATKLTEIFFHTTDELSHSVVTEVCRSEGQGVLLILDGFDEVPSSLVILKDSLIMKLICSSCLPKATRLVTSRPSALHHRSKFPDNHKHVEILGFTDERKEEFAENAFLEQSHLTPGFKAYYLSNAIIKSLMYIPLNCAIIAQVYKENEGKGLVMPQTMTQLYTALIASLIRRYMIEKSVWNENSNIPSNSDIIHASALKEVSELAYRGLTKEETQIVFTESDVGEGFQHLGLLSETKEMYVSSGAKSSYSFPHLSIQEFLAALHLVHSATFEELSSFLASKDNWKKNMARFVAGLVGCCCCFPITKIEWGKYEYHDNKRQLMMNCLYEAQNSCKSMLDLNITDVVPYTCSNPLDMYVFGYVLGHAPIQWNLELKDYADVTQLVKSCSSVKSQPLGTLCELVLEELESPCTLLEFNNHNKYPGSPPPSLEWVSSLRKLHKMDVIVLCPSVGEVIPTPTATVGKIFNFVTGLNFLTDIVVICYGGDYEPAIVKLGWLAEAALSHPTLKTFSINIPFFVLPQAVTSSLESLTYQDYYYLGFLSTFCCIVEMCKTKNLKIELYHRKDLNPVFDKYLVIFNHFLQNSSSWSIIFDCGLGLQSMPNYLRGPFSRALRTDPDLLWLKRSKSLSDLSTELYTLNEEQVHSMYGCELIRYGKLTRSQSCPELLHMQALHNMHPHLHQALKTRRLYGGARYSKMDDYLQSKENAVAAVKKFEIVKASWEMQ